jgi:hypothetical protein
MLEITYAIFYWLSTGGSWISPEFIPGPDRGGNPGRQTENELMQGKIVDKNKYCVIMYSRMETSAVFRAETWI